MEERNKKERSGKGSGDSHTLSPQIQHLSQRCFIKFHKSVSLVPTSLLPQPLPQLPLSPVPKLILPHHYNLPHSSSPQMCPGPCWRTSSLCHPVSLFLKLCMKLLLSNLPLPDPPSHRHLHKTSTSPTLAADTCAVGCCSPPCPSSPPEIASDCAPAASRGLQRHATITSSRVLSQQVSSVRRGELWWG